MSTFSGYSHFQPLFEDALREYESQAGTKLVDHPLYTQLNTCTSVDSIIKTVLAEAQAFRQFRGDDSKVMKCLKGAVHVLSAFSAGVFGEAIGLPFQPAKAIFAGIGVLLTAIKDVSASYDALSTLLESIEHFLKRLEIYTRIPSVPALDEIMVKIIVALLSTLALATKHIKQGRLKKFGKKLFGENDVEDILQRLDRLTHDEARTTAAQTLAVVCGLVENTKTAMDNDNVKTSTDDIRQALEILQKVASEMNLSKRRRLRDWLSPPDPWKNYNIAREALHEGTTTWLTQGDTFMKWKSSGALLWVHGKPGSGKSVLSSAVIQDLEDSSKLGLAPTTFYFFDFRDKEKQTRRGLISSLLVQLCDQSGTCYNILCDLFSAHCEGSREPSEGDMTRCLKNMIVSLGRVPIFIIIDALDECSNTFGTPSARETVLSVVRDIHDLRLSNLHICITSRPEPDIKNTLVPLASQSLSVHDQAGQRRDIMDYIVSVVNQDPAMRKWRQQDKKLVIETLSQRADGMFRWVHCQLDFLRRCLPQRIRRALDEIPETLDETYERTLERIDRANVEYARLLLQCVTVAARPLQVEEVAEFLAFDFDSEAGPIPNYNADWRPEDPEDTVLSICASLLAVVKVDGSRVIQFSHYSVKEFLVSDRISQAGGTVPRYRVLMGEAHTIVVLACLAILLRPYANKKITHDGPLVLYSAQHWVGHARFGNDLSRIQEAGRRLFDPRHRHFSVWIRIHDILPEISPMATDGMSQLVLRYAAFCGLPDVVEFLVTKRSQNVNPQSNQYLPPPLHFAAEEGHQSVTKLLLELDANANGRGRRGWTPLHMVSFNGHLAVAQVLLGHGANTNLLDHYGKTPLHWALEKGHPELAQALLEYDPDIKIQDDCNITPLHHASEKGYLEVVQTLLERFADVNARDDHLLTSLHRASAKGYLEVVQALLEYHADKNARDEQKKTPLLWALETGRLEVVGVLLKNGADPNIPDDNNMTALHQASAKGYLETVLDLLEGGADPNASDEYKMAPLHRASENGHPAIVRALLERGVDPNVRDNDNRTPLHDASEMGYLDVVFALFEYNADANARDDENKTPLHWALENGRLTVVRALLERGANPNIRDDDNRTPLHLASLDGPLELVQVLLDHVASVNSTDNCDNTPLHLAYQNGHEDIVNVLLQNGADPNARDRNNRIPSQRMLENWDIDFNPVHRFSDLGLAQPI